MVYVTVGSLQDWEYFCADDCREGELLSADFVPPAASSAVHQHPFLTKNSSRSPLLYRDSTRFLTSLLSVSLLPPRCSSTGAPAAVSHYPWAALPAAPAAAASPRAARPSPDLTAGDPGLLLVINSPWFSPTSLVRLPDPVRLLPPVVDSLPRSFCGWLGSLLGGGGWFSDLGDRLVVWCGDEYEAGGARLPPARARHHVAVRVEAADRGGRGGRPGRRPPPAAAARQGGRRQGKDYIVSGEKYSTA